jgi:hypothetical protein
MNIATLKTFGLSCVYCLFVVFSVSANAAIPDPTGSGVSIEGWLSAGKQDLPILTFEEPRLHEDLLEDIRVENVTIDQDGATRFQLTNSGAMSRQVFAHVRRVEQDDGYTRSIITNVADGQQMEFLTETAKNPLRGEFDKEKANEMLIQASLGGDQNVECPWCVWGGILLTEAICMAGVTNAHVQCRLDCQMLGGVESFYSGICGMHYSECKCMVDPKRIADEFNFQ